MRTARRRLLRNVLCCNLTFSDTRLFLSPWQGWLQPAHWTGIVLFLLSWQSDPINPAQAGFCPAGQKPPALLKRSAPFSGQSQHVQAKQPCASWGLCHPSLRDVQVTLSCSSACTELLQAPRAVPPLDLGTWWSLLSPHTLHKGRDPPHPTGRGWFGVGIDHGKLPQLPRVLL